MKRMSIYIYVCVLFYAQQWAILDPKRTPQRKDSSGENLAAPLPMSHPYTSTKVSKYKTRTAEVKKAIERRHWAWPSLENIPFWPLGFHLRNERGVYLDSRCKRWDMVAKNRVFSAVYLKKGRLSTPKKNAKHRRQSRTCVPNVWRPTLPPHQQQLSTCPVSRATPYTKATAHRWTAKTRERHWEKTLGPTLSQSFHSEKRKTYTRRSEKGQLVDVSYQSRSIAISRPTSSCTFHVVGKKICIGTASS